MVWLLVENLPPLAVRLEAVGLLGPVCQALHFGSGRAVGLQDVVYLLPVSRRGRGRPRATSGALGPETAARSFFQEALDTGSVRRPGVNTLRFRCLSAFHSLSVPYTKLVGGGVGVVNDIVGGFATTNESLL